VIERVSMGEGPVVVLLVLLAGWSARGIRYASSVGELLGA